MSHRCVDVFERRIYGSINVRLSYYIVLVNIAQMSDAIMANPLQSTNTLNQSIVKVGVTKVSCLLFPPHDAIWPASSCEPVIICVEVPFVNHVKAPKEIALHIS